MFVKLISSGNDSVMDRTDEILNLSEFYNIISSDNELNIDANGWMATTDTARDQLLGHIDMPRRFYAHMINKGLPLNLSNDIGKLCGVMDKPVMVRRLNRVNGRIAIALLSPSYFRINHDFVTDALKDSGVDIDGEGQPIGGDDFEIKKMELTPDRLHIRMLTRGLETGEIGVGLDITNSETGLYALNVSTFVYVLACSNGMIIKNKDLGSLRKVHRTTCAERGVLGDPSYCDARYQDLSGDIVRRVCAARDERVLMEIQKTVDRSKELTEPKVIDRVESRINKMLTAPERVKYPVYRKTEPANVWGSVQALTAMAHNEPSIEDTPRQSDLETRAWDELDQAVRGYGFAPVM
jgi:hypothetical protein